MKWFVAAMLPFLAAGAASVVVETPLGAVEGFEHTTSTNESVSVFLGLRYATANRFERPQLVSNWNEVVNATQFGPKCHQWIAPYEAFPKDFVTPDQFGEDCLRVNIITPNTKPKTPLPVFVWIYGGGMEFGDAASYGYQTFAEQFGTRDIIVVSIQYRLGAFGFFALNDVKGNNGHWDQAAALKFINQVIPSFGGDVNRITVGGESAGGSSTSGLIMSKHSNKLFQQAIQISGSLFAEWANNKKRVIDTSEKLAKALGCFEGLTGAQTIECMQNKSVQTIQQAQIGNPQCKGPNCLVYMGYLDNDFFHSDPISMLKQAPKIATLSGFNDNEAATFVLPVLAAFCDVQINTSIPYTQDMLEEYITRIADKETFGITTNSFRKLLKKHYITRNLDINDPTYFVQQYTQSISDTMFTMPVIEEIFIKQRLGWNSYFYINEYQSNNTWDQAFLPGASHGSELRYFTDFILFSKAFPQNHMSVDDYTFQDNYVKTLAAFIETGNPSHSGITWPATNWKKPFVHGVFGPSLTIVDDYEDPEAIHMWLNKAFYATLGKVSARLPGISTSYRPMCKKFKPFTTQCTSFKSILA